MLNKKINDSARKSTHKARAIMIQGTMSNAGKSLICAGLCRILKQDGYRVAPFKVKIWLLTLALPRMASKWDVHRSYKRKQLV